MRTKHFVSKCFVRLTAALTILLVKMEIYIKEIKGKKLGKNIKK